MSGHDPMGASTAVVAERLNCYVCGDYGWFFRDAAAERFVLRHRAMHSPRFRRLHSAYRLRRRKGRW